MPDVTKLPKWAQDLLIQKDRRIVELEALAHAGGWTKNPPENAEVVLDRYAAAERFQRLPMYDTVRYPKQGIRVDIERSPGLRGWLRICGTDMRVMPGASNVVYVLAREEEL